MKPEQLHKFSTNILDMDRKTLKKLRLALPKGWAQIITERLNDEFSPVTVQKVIYGQRNNEKILDLAIELAREKKEAEERRNRIVEEITS